MALAQSAPLAGLPPQTSPVPSPAPAKAPTKAKPPAKPAQPTRTLSDDLDDDSTIYVTGRKPPGAVVSDIPPEQQLNAGDIRALGVSSVTELLDELAPQIRSDRGRGGEQPVVLLNGRRISSFAEIRDIPAEAIVRVDILPEEVALSYGYSADQKVVNIVLRRRFRAVTAEAEGGTTTEGGGHLGDGQVTLLHIVRDQRLNLSAKYQASAAITEADRNLISRSGGGFDPAGNIAGIAPGGEIDPALSALAGAPVTIAGVPASAAGGAPTLGDFLATANQPNAANLGRYRTIRPETKQLDLNAVYSRNILGNVAATLNATLNVTDSDSLQGLPGASLILPAGNPFSPFGQDVAVLRDLGNQPLTQSTDGVTGHLGFSLNKDMAKWRLSLTGNYDHGVSTTRTERGFVTADLQAALDAGDPAVNPFGTIPARLLDARFVDHARSVSNSGNVQLVANGPLFSLPAGTVKTSLKGGFEALGFDASSTRAGIASSSDLSRTDVNGRVTLDVPLTSRKEGVLGAIGDLSVNGNAGIDRYSDFGALEQWGYGANWQVRKGVGLVFSVSHDRAPPTVQQLGNPAVLTPNVRTFDYIRGVTVDISQLGGGNPALEADRRRVTKLGLTLKPFSSDITITADYVNSRIRNAIASFPEPTAAIEAAFPDRFFRDEDGNLVRIDARPINFASESRSELRWGINITHKLKTSERLVEALRSSPRLKAEFEKRRAAFQAREAAQAQAGGNATPPNPPPDGARGEGGTPGQGGGAGQGGVVRDGRPGDGQGRPGGGQGRGGGFGGFGGFGGGNNPAAGGRLNLALYHTWHFKDEVLIRRGLPVLDLLHGDAIGSNGGTPKHEIEAQFGYANNGVGARLTGNWHSGTTVDAAPGSLSGNLRFSPLTTLNARLFVNLGQLIPLIEKGWAQGARVQLRVDNLLDTHPRVHDATGATPLRYQAGYLDPAGRTIRIEIRKLFF
jgi:hypothetical protein